MLQAATGSNTHVLLMDDYQDNEPVNINCLKANTTLEQAVIPGFRNRSGRKRVNFVEKCDIEAILRFFTEKKKQSQVFVFPYHIKET